MAKKHWIYLKRGLSEDPKHRARMNECIWLFMHIIDRADWETGIAYDWKDEEEAAGMGMNVATLRAQRQKLDRLDYVRCFQKQHSQDIKIMEWINPRDYSAGVLNRREGEVETVPSTPALQGAAETVPSDFQGDSQGDSQGLSPDCTPTLSSESDSSSLGGLSEKEVEQANKKVDAMIAAGKNPRSYTNRSQVPEIYLPYCDLYVALCGKDPDGKWNQVPTKRVLSDWLLTFDEWKQENLKDEHIRAAYEYATRPDGGFLVSRPAALTRTAVAMKTKLITQSKPAVNDSAVEQTKQEIVSKDAIRSAPRPADLPSPAAIRAKMNQLAQERKNKNVLSQP